MSLFRYRPKDCSGAPLFVALNPEQIKESLKSFPEAEDLTLKIPSDYEIEKVGLVEIVCSHPMYHVDHFVDIEVAGKEKSDWIFRLHVNANAFDYAHKQVEDYQRVNRGGMYRLHGGISHYVFFSPEIFEKLKSYDWDQHRPQIDEWNLGPAEDKLRFLEKLGIIGRIRVEREEEEFKRR